MKKVKLTPEEINLLHEYAGLKSKQEILNNFRRHYQFGQYVDPDWFDKDEIYWIAVDEVSKRDKAARRLIAKLNQMSDRVWEKEYGQK